MSTLAMAQCFVTCPTCETEIEVNWKCNSCGMYCCYRCGKTHVSLQKNKDHTVYNVRETNGLPILKTVRCQIHSDKDISTYCEKCDRFMCTKCLGESLNQCQHFLKELEDIHAEKITILDQYSKQIDKNFMEFFIKEGNKLQKVMDIQKENYENERQKIIEHGQNLKDLITLRTNKLLLELDGHWENLKHEKNTLTSMLDRKIKYFGSKLSLIDEIKKFIDIKIVHTRTKEIKDFVLSEDISFITQPNETKKLQKGQVSQKLVDQLVGSLTSETISNIDFKVLNSYTTDLESVGSITAGKQNTIWIKSGIDSVLRKIELGGELLKTLNEIKYSNIVDITLLDSGNLLFTVQNNPCIKQLEPSGEVTTFYTFPSKWLGHPQIPLALHVDSEGCICVGTMEASGNRFNISKTSCRQVTILSTTGETLRLFEYDGDGNRLFTCPLRITSNKLRDIFVVDNGTRIVALSNNGKLKWIYTGSPERQYQFSPADIVTTINDNIIVCDFNNAFHILNCQGQLIEFINTENFGIVSPMCLHLDHQSHLISGCWHADNDDHAIIHILLFTGC